MLNYWSSLSNVSQELAWMNPSPVYIGGAVIPLYLDTFGQTQIRPTLDVDCVVPKITTRLEFSNLESELRRRGWQPDMKGPICRYLGGNNLIVDFMPVTPSVLGFAGKWYNEIVNSAVNFELPDGHNILIPDVGVLFACKLEAFFDRGADEPYESKDLEDIAALLDGAANLYESLSNLNDDIRIYIIKSLATIGSNKFYMSVLESQLPRGGDEKSRLENFRTLFQKIII